MAVIGCLGDIPFTVSEDVVRTVSSFKWGGSARFAVHQRPGTDALTEFLGVDPDTFSLPIELSAELGVDPNEEIARLFAYEREGRPLPLVLGEKAYGKYRWCIQSHETESETFDRYGNLYSARVTVELLEYLRG